MEARKRVCMQTRSLATIGSPVSATILRCASRARLRGSQDIVAGKVMVLGGGVAGMTAAHELAARGFDVVVYELRPLPGGKARSMDAIPGTGGRRALPGEHGFRFFPGFYKHVPDTMSRIPYGHQPHGVFDNLVVSTQLQIARDDARNELVAPAHFPNDQADWEAISRFALSLSAASVFFFWTTVASAFSYPVAAWLARRIGLINTMVFTHIPSNILLLLAAFSPYLWLTLVLLLIRAALSQMDVPTRTSYVMAVVTPQERPAAASVTAVPRSLASAISPAIAGALLSTTTAGVPLVICGALKIAYDVALLYSFRHIKPPEEQG